MTQYPPTPPGPGAPPTGAPPTGNAPPQHPGASYVPHRGAMALTFGILGLVFDGCAPVGVGLAIAAWTISSRDLADINNGRVDPSGRGLLQAGKILGIIGVVLGAIIMAVWLIFLLSSAMLIGAGATGAPGSFGP